MTTVRLDNPFPQFFDNVGEFLSLGSLWFYEAGTQTLQDTYPTADESGTPNPNPVPLGNDGRPVVPVFTKNNTIYRLESHDASGQVVAVFDHYVSSFDKGSDYLSGVSYEVNETVRSEVDAERYVSLIDHNTTAPEVGKQWSQYQLIRLYNSLETYRKDDTVLYLDGLIYSSLVDNNTGNAPPLSPEQWLGGTVSASSANGYLSITQVGQQSVTGLGFKPNTLLVNAVHGKETPSYEDVMFSYGYANSSGDQQSASLRINTETYTNGFAVANTGTVAYFQDPVDATQRTNINLISFDSDGFTLNVTVGASSISPVSLAWEVYA